MQAASLWIFLFCSCPVDMEGVQELPWPPPVGQLESLTNHLDSEGPATLQSISASCLSADSSSPSLLNTCTSPSGSKAPASSPHEISGGSSHLHSGNCVFSLWKCRILKISLSFYFVKLSFDQIWADLYSGLEIQSLDTPSSRSAPVLWSRVRFISPGDMDRIVGGARPTSSMLDPCRFWLGKEARGGLRNSIRSIVNA